ncbi:MAG: DUF1501 domain-containing protein [Planctomycetaceae bacterium]|nr:DUF1501 domain-containing protein [Planctomycetaceae bacterium]
MQNLASFREAVTRRHFFDHCGLGIGKMALASLLTGLGTRAAAFATPPPTGQLAVTPPHFPAKAKSVIHLFMAGAPSQLDLFDYKESLVKHAGEPVPPEIIKDQRYAFIRPDAAMLAPQFKFARHGQSGAEICEALPHLAEIVDEIAIIKSVHTDQFNHAPAQLLMSTGAPQPGRPCMGAWVTYGLGAATDSLPSFVVLSSFKGTSGGASNWSNGFLPSLYQGVPFRSQGDPILNVSSPAGFDRRLQRASLDLVESLNREHLGAAGDPEITTRISAYEMAYRMQSSAPELMDLSSETPETLALYGVEPNKPSFAANCLLARRLVERGVRFVSLLHEGWDHHTDLVGGIRTQCGLTDRPAAALIKDLKARGLLDETLVIWGGEFGRTPMVQSGLGLTKSPAGRDHHPQAFSVWLAGGGIRRGVTYGKTDDIGFRIAEDPVHVHDLQATILHLLGLDHERLTFTSQGRKFRLTDVSGQVIQPILA